VHRGPNGGLKAAGVKTYEERKLKEKGMSVPKFEHLNALGARIDRGRAAGRWVDIEPAATRVRHE
jgi:hypothetical protein